MHWINNDKEEVQNNIELGQSFKNQTPYVIMCMCDKQRIQWESTLNKLADNFSIVSCLLLCLYLVWLLPIA